MKRYILTSINMAMLYTLLFVIGISFFYQKELQKTSYSTSYAQIPVSPIIFLELEQALISEIPSIPQYPNAIIDESYKKVVTGEQGYEAEWITTDSVKEALLFYQKALPEDGWTIDFMPENIEAYETQIEAHKNEQKLFLMIEVAETRENITEIVAEFPLSQL